MSQILQAMKDDDKGYKSLHWYLSALAKTETPTTNRLVIRSVFSNTKKEGEEERPYIFLNKSPEKGITANPYCSIGHCAVVSLRSSDRFIIGTFSTYKAPTTLLIANVAEGIPQDEGTCLRFTKSLLRHSQHLT
jgi:hypothetical protein